MATNAIDVWTQHPTRRHFQHEMFDSRRRWMGMETPTEELPLDLTFGAMDEGGVSVGLTAAWYGPSGDLIHNDGVARFVAERPDRRKGVASAAIHKPMEVVRERRDRVEEGFVGPRLIPWLWEVLPTDRRYTACVDLGIPLMITPGRVLDRLAELQLDAETEHTFLRSNAERVGL